MATTTMPSKGHVSDLTALVLVVCLCSGLTLGQENVAASVNTTTQMSTESTTTKASMPSVVAGATPQPAVMNSSSTTIAPTQSSVQGSQDSQTPSPMSQSSTAGSKATPQVGAQDSQTFKTPSPMAQSSTPSTKATPQSGAQGSQGSQTPSMMAQPSTPNIKATPQSGAQGSQGSQTPSPMAQSSTPSTKATPQSGAQGSKGSQSPSTMAQSSTTSSMPPTQAGVQDNQASLTPSAMAKSSTASSKAPTQAGGSSQSPAMMPESSTTSSTSTVTPTVRGVIINQSTKTQMSSTISASTPPKQVQSTTGTVSPKAGSPMVSTTTVSAVAVPSSHSNSSSRNDTGQSSKTPTPMSSTTTPTASSARSPMVQVPGTSGAAMNSTASTNLQTEGKTVSVPPTYRQNSTVMSRTTIPIMPSAKTPRHMPSTTWLTRRTTAKVSHIPAVGTTMKTEFPVHTNTTKMIPRGSMSTAIPAVVDGSTPRMVTPPRTPMYSTPQGTVRMTDSVVPTGVVPRKTSMSWITPMHPSRPDTARSTPSKIQTGPHMTSVTLPETTHVRLSTRVVETTTPRPVTTRMIRSTTSPRIISTMKTPTTESSTIPSTEIITPIPEMPKDVTYRIRFDGSCAIILTNNDVRDKFEKQLKEMLMNKVGVPQDNVLLHDISCGSVDVLVTLHDVIQSKVEKRLDVITANPVPLTVSSEGQTHAFLPVSYTMAEPSTTTAPPPPPQASKSKGLRSVDMIIIIIVSIVGGMLMIIIIALIVHECRRRSHTKSFDLRGTPRPHINMEDFTLTKMERGPAEYNEYGLVLDHQRNGHSRTPQVGIATIVETPNQNGGATCNGYHKTGKEGYEPESDVGPDSPSISLMKSMRTPTTEGIENPSFSSEDILDSGTETDRENVSSDKGIDSPDHAPFQVDPTIESDSGRQSDSPNELPQDTDTPLQHSPRSNVSDNTSSDNAYEPFELDPIVEAPTSPSSEEVMMPTEEMGYPAGNTEDDESPPPKDIISHSPQDNTYEMVETKKAGTRESDFFAPAEGATAF